MERYQGILRYRLHYAGSRSEGYYATLEREEGSEIRLCRKGSLPYNDSELGRHDGQRVSVTGTVDHGWLVLEQLEVLGPEAGDPAGSEGAEQGTTAGSEGTNHPEQGTTAGSEGTEHPEQGTTAGSEGTDHPEQGTTAGSEGIDHPEQETNATNDNLQPS